MTIVPEFAPVYRATHCPLNDMIALTPIFWSSLSSNPRSTTGSTPTTASRDLHRPSTGARWRPGIFRSNAPVGRLTDAAPGFPPPGAALPVPQRAGRTASTTAAAVPGVVLCVADGIVRIIVRAGYDSRGRP